MIWRTLLNDERKDRIVVDIKELNEIAEFDSYSLSLQSDVISTIVDYAYIFTIDVIEWFHQFNVRRNDRSKFIIVNHREQKKSSVILMKYKKSSSYVQRQTDKLLRSYKHFAKAYIDDIIIFSRTLAKHLKHLRIVFDLFKVKRVNLSSTKFFLAYSSITLLE